MESPLNIYPGESFNLSIFGVIVPSYELRYSDKYKNETIFIAVDPAGNDQFAEYIHLSPPEVQPIDKDFKYLVLNNIDIPFLEVRAISDHKIFLTTQTLLPANSGLFVLFMPEYSTFQIKEYLECMIELYDARNFNYKKFFKNLNKKNYFFPPLKPPTVLTSFFLVNVQ
jgi:hypothetical protein